MKVYDHKKNNSVQIQLMSIYKFSTYEADISSSKVLKKRFQFVQQKFNYNKLYIKKPIYLFFF